MKYTLYRSFGNLDSQVKKHTLVAVEYGSNIDAVTESLVQDVADDLAETPEYAGCDTTAYAPEPVRCTRRVKRYQYEMMGAVLPPNAPENILIDYGITETAET
ncbi:MAG: carboxylate--amine ligase [Eubacterium sp.]|nr:carboxylate--amine ligase [Eubacterium sp.]